MGRVPWPARLAIAAMAIAVAMAPLIPGSTARAAASSASVQPVVTSLSVPGYLFGVAAISAGNAWAVGSSSVSGGGEKTLIVHWNGGGWAQVTTPRPVYGSLEAVTAISADNIWAVGESLNAKGTGDKTLIMHWNGRTWSRQNAPAISADLYAVAGTAKSVWAVGGALIGHLDSPAVVMHWTGGHWYVVPTSAPVFANLFAVAVMSGGTAWAGGFALGANPTATSGLLMRWNGSAWKRVSYPLEGSDNSLGGLAAGPRGAMWAVGWDSKSNYAVTWPVSMLWSGKSWRKKVVPAPKNSVLLGVSFIPGGTAWAVGYTGTAVSGALIVHWTGSAWTRVPTPEDRVSSAVNDVAVTSPANAWAVGNVEKHGTWMTLILHWNGKTWS